MGGFIDMIDKMEKKHRPTVFLKVATNCRIKALVHSQKKLCSFQTQFNVKRQTTLRLFSLFFNA